jgi:hypothetical protein
MPKRRVRSRPSPSPAPAPIRRGLVRVDPRARRAIVESVEMHGYSATERRFNLARDLVRAVVDDAFVREGSALLVVSRVASQPSPLDAA